LQIAIYAVNLLLIQASSEVFSNHMVDGQNVNTARLFYAWQDDLPKKFNRYAIKKALQVAAAELEAELSNRESEPFKIEVDEATRGVPGSPNIPKEILKKIRKADMFVADVSSINSQQIDERKKTPNPNVVFELGYAVAVLGWKRIILLVNEVHGSLSALPFDFDRHRAFSFQLAENRGSEQHLRGTLREAIELILNENPERPNSFDLAQTKRGRDLSAIQLFLGSIHWPTLDEHINAGPKYLSTASTIFFEKANEIVRSSTFHLYDDDLRAAILALVREWDESMKFDHYIPMLHKPAYAFKSGHYPRDFDKAQKDFKYMEKARLRMREAADGLLSLIREKFPEIDIQKASQAAAADYDTEMATIEKQFDEAVVSSKRRGAGGSGRTREKKKPNAQ
jgi:hypothetical protein